jgi:hypothetical protein
MNAAIPNRRHERRQKKPSREHAKTAIFRFLAGRAFASRESILALPGVVAKDLDEMIRNRDINIMAIDER